MTAPVSEWSTPSHMKPAQLYARLEETDLPIEWEPVTPLEWEDFERAHDAAYVEAVRRGEPPSVAEEASVAWSPALAESLRW